MPISGAAAGAALLTMGTPTRPTRAIFGHRLNEAARAGSGRRRAFPRAARLAAPAGDQNLGRALSVNLSAFHFECPWDQCWWARCTRRPRSRSGPTRFSCGGLVSGGLGRSRRR
ncbi:MAG: hypothetical protein RLZZ157_700 [Pseudomonadota bacterium]|jgi:hypothetical protein